MDVQAHPGASGVAAGPPTTESGDPPTPEEREAARRLAAYWDPPSNPFTAVFYALHVRSRRREIEKRGKRARADREKAIDQADAAFVELGRALHMRAHELDLSPVAYFVGEADRLALIMEQSGRDRRARNDAKEHLQAAWMQIGEHVWQRGIGHEEPERLAHAVAAVRAGEAYTREARLCEIGVDMYDPSGVRMGYIVLAVALVVSIAGLIAALLHAR